MIAVPEKDFAFIHIPKTGGTSIRDSIKRQETTRVVDAYNKRNSAIPFQDFYYHLSREDLHSYHPEFDCANTFVVVRNPYDRLLSAFFQHLKAPGFATSNYPQGFNFLRWLETARELDRPMSWGLSKWVDVSRDNVLRFEGLETQLGPMSEILGYDVDLLHLNESYKHLLNFYEEPNDMLSTAAKARITELYQEDFDLFGFDIQS